MSTDETTAAPAADEGPPPKLKVTKRKKPALRPIGLGHGVFAQARGLDAFEHATTLAQARADMNALLAGVPPLYAWTFTPERLAELQASEDLRQVTLGWMRNVLTATMSVARLDDGKGGPAPLELETYAEDGETLLDARPMEACFATFEMLFQDQMIEMRFRVAAFETESLWSAEKNVSGPAPNGRGPEGSNIAQLAETPATHALEAEREQMPMAEQDGALSAETHREPPSETSHGTSPPEPAAGSAQA